MRVPSSENTGPTLFDMTTFETAEVTTFRQLSLFAEDSPARTFPPPDESAELPPRAAACGPSLPVSLASYDPATCSWRTSQDSFVADLIVYSATWPRSGMMRSGTAYPLPPLVPYISGTESLFWPTPTANNRSGGAALTKWGGSTARSKLRRIVTPEELNGPLNPEFCEWLMGFPIGWSALMPSEMP